MSNTIKAEGLVVVDDLRPGSVRLVTTDYPTRRERIATAALQGLASDPDLVDPERVAELAVGFADALIAELDKEQKG